MDFLNEKKIEKKGKIGKKKYKKIQDRYFAKCLETKIVNGATFICNFQNKREDKVKQNIKQGKLNA